MIVRVSLAQTCWAPKAATKVTAAMNRSGVLDMIPDNLSVRLTDDQTGRDATLDATPAQLTRMRLSYSFFENVLGPPILTG